MYFFSRFDVVCASKNFTVLNGYKNACEKLQSELNEKFNEETYTQTNWVNKSI